MIFELPKLDYSKDALAPIMSEETLDLHHGKHHQTYITNLNNFIKDTDMSKMTLEEIILNSAKDKTKTGIFNNASQHWNHLLFWKCMKPNGGGSMPSKLKERIISDFGSIEEFKKHRIIHRVRGVGRNPPRGYQVGSQSADGCHACGLFDCSFNFTI